MNRACTAVTVWFAAMAVLSRGVRSAAASPLWKRQVRPLQQRPLAFSPLGYRLAMVSRPRRAAMPHNTRRLDVCMAAMATRPPAVQDALAVVREELKQRGLDAFVIPSGDPHLSEYAADHFCRRAFISGFDGSAGTAVVTTTEALLWTDGRYFLQAEQQLGQDWQLMRDGQKGVPTLSAYLKERLPGKAVVGLDPRVHPVKFVTSLAKTLAAKDVTVRPIGTSEQNPIDVAWGQQRPVAPRAPVRVHPLSFAGETVASKLDKIKAKMEEEGAAVLVACVLDEVAWLLNIRGSDVPNCPLPVSYATVELVPSAANPKAMVARPRLFVEDVKLGEEVKRHLQGANVEIRPYDEIFSYLSSLASQGKKIWLDADKSNYALLQAAVGSDVAAHEVEEKASKAVVTKPSPITLLKAIKNRVELEGMRACHLRDGAAEVEFLAWLDRTLTKEGRAVSEMEIDQVLTGFRAKRDKFLGLSFDTIAGAGANGAIIHYRATADKAAMMGASKMLLLDSGAQYEDGTTDVTRTMHFGEPTDFQKRCFTRVLQGNIAIDTAVFPEGTPGFVLDAYARRALWQEGLDYGHGTGHGVGAALNVHEGPQGISFNFANQTPLQPGMVLSNEPGFYQAGEFGIRIENLLVVVPATDGPAPQDPKQRQYLKFEKLTHIPICKRLIVKELLAPEEVRWLDDYHAQVWERVSPLVESEEARAWLFDATRPL